MPSVRPSARLSLAAATVALSAISLPAARAEMAPICPMDESHVLVEFDTAGGYHTRIAYYSPGPTETDICIQTLGSVQTVIAVTSEVPLAPPRAMRSTNPQECPHRLVDVDSPVVHLAAGFSVEGRTICFGIDGDMTTITLPGPTPGALPNAAIWLPANSFVNQWGWCGRYYAAHQADKATHEKWRECYQQDNRVG